mgnify:CR=1 FL=1
MQGVLHTLSVEGDLAEVGVYNGGSAKIIRETVEGELHLFDTFQGLIGGQILSYEEKYSAGDYRTPFDEVSRNLKGLENISYHIGDVVQMKEDVADKKFRFIHIDLDLYVPLKGCIDFFFKHLAKGGIMLVSNYDEEHPGVKKVVDEFKKPTKRYSRFVFYKK